MEDKPTASSPPKQAGPLPNTALINHARRELELAGAFDKSGPDGGKIAESIMELVTLYAKQGHSNSSAGVVLQVFGVLTNWELLTEPTTNPKEWRNVSKEFKTPMWQNKRCGKYFSKDGGATWEHVDTQRMGRSVAPKKDEVSGVPDEKPKSEPKAESPKKPDSETTNGGK